MTDKLIIFDTTLRDGEQSPGASMTRDEKLRIARQLERLRVDVIEAGFAASSNGDFEAVKAIADAIKDSTVCSLARANDRDISRAAEALKGAASSRIHTFIATSALHMEKKLRMTPDQVLEQARLAVRFARNLCDDVEFSPEDGYRSDPDFLCRVLEAVIAEGATTINIPDTVGLRDSGAVRRVHPQPARAHSELRQGGLVGALPQRPRHGGGQLAGRREDRRRAPGRMHDQRPRRARRQLLARRGGDGGEDAHATTSASSSASTRRRSCRRRAWCRQTTGFVVQPNKAVVGANAFAHASGIHQDGVLKARDTYEIMRAEDVGWAANKIVLGKLSGRNAFKQRLQELGIALESEAEVNAAFARFKDLADRKSEIFDEDIIALVSDESVTAEHEHYRLLALSQHSETGERPHASVAFAAGAVEHHAESDGNGPVDASLKAIESKVQSGAETAALFGQCHHLGQHRVAGRGDGAAAARRAGGQRRRRRPGHRGGLGKGLPRGAEQAAQQDRARGGTGLSGHERDARAGCLRSRAVGGALSGTGVGD